MEVLIIVIVVVVVLVRLGRVQGPRDPGFRLIIPFIDVLHRVSLRIVTMPVQSQGIITRDNVSADVSAVAYFRAANAVKSVAAIENVSAAIGRIAQTTLRKVVGRHTLDQTPPETDKINLDIRKVLDVSTAARGAEVTLVELKDIQLPDSMQRAMARPSGRSARRSSAPSSAPSSPASRPPPPPRPRPPTTASWLAPPPTEAPRTKPPGRGNRALLAVPDLGHQAIPPSESAAAACSPSAGLAGARAGPSSAAVSVG